MMLVFTLVLQAAIFADATLQPQCLAPIGLRDLAQVDPQASGTDIMVGMVELSQPGLDQPGAYAFMPNIQHQALAEANWGGFYYNEYPNRPVAYSDHASIIAALLVGADDQAWFEPLGDFRYRGIAPDVRLNVYETHWFLYNRVLTQQMKSPGDDIITISWGTETDDVITAWWQRGIDALVERESCLVVAGCGNGPAAANSITKPACGYNVIAVGAARSLGDWPMYLRYVGWPEPGHSGCGPTADGRAKPDVIAPAAVLGPADRTTDEYCLADEFSGGSSFAAPQVAGVAAILMQAARRESFNRGDDPRLIKALILNGADKLAGWRHGRATSNDDHQVPLDYLQGAGLLNAWNSYQQLLAGPNPPDAPAQNTGWNAATLALDAQDPNSQHIYYPSTDLKEGDTFKATLCWNRHFQSDRLYLPMPLADLALELWSVDDEGNLVQLLDYSDSKQDNLEHIYYRSPAAHRVALVVRSAETAAKQGTEDYAVAWTSEDENWLGDRLRGDLNADGVVDVKDAEQLIRLWIHNQTGGSSGTPGYSAPEDLNLDGRVNTDDFTLLKQQWQQQSEWHTPASVRP
jgi:hypothetical protein